MIRITTGYISSSSLASRCFIRTIGTNARPPSGSPKASLEQLQAIADRISPTFNKFFVETHDYSPYSKDVVFIDNIRTVKTQGIKAYALQLSLIKVYHNLAYSSKKMEMLSLVKVPEESCVRVRWRIILKPGLLRLYLLHFYRWNKSDEFWKDGISTLHVNKDGFIYCHVCDNIDVDIDLKEGKIKKTIKSQLVNRGLSV